MNSEPIPGPDAPTTRNKLAPVSLILGGAGFLLFLIAVVDGYFWKSSLSCLIFPGLISGIVGAIVGNMARRQIKKANGSRKDKLMATIGINLGLAPLLYSCLFLIYITPQIH